MKANCVLKKDSKETLSEKRKFGKVAEDQMNEHMNDKSTSEHNLYSSEKLFPIALGDLIWENGGYLPRGENQDVVLSQIDIDFVEELKETRMDGLENHFVSVMPRVRRDAKDSKRPEKIAVGHIVVIKNAKNGHLPCIWVKL